MSKYSIRYGLYAGIVIELLFFITLFIFKDSRNYDFSMLIGYATMVLALSMIFFGIKSYRDKELGGVITFGRAFLAGLVITLIADLVYSGGWMIFSHLIDPEFEPKMMASGVESLKHSGKSAEEINKAIAQMKANQEMMKNPVVEFLMVYLIEMPPVGIVISLISAWILRKKRVDGK